jgi:hypothetical protein
VGGVLLTSFLFGLMHLNPPQAVGAAALGVALHCVYLTTRSLLLPMLLHCANNTVALFMSRSADPDSLGQPEELTPLLCAAAAVLAVAAGWALYRSRVRLESKDPALAPWRPWFPGVELPPSDTGTVLVRSWPGWLSSGLVLGALAVFVATIILTGGL